jgi:hypothetical protein
MPAAILWSTLIAWLLLVAVSLIELFQHRRGRSDAAARLNAGPDRP